MINEDLINEMIDDWLWDKYFDELRSQAITEVEKEEGFWRSVCGVKQKVKDRHWKLHEELKQRLTEERSSQ